MDAMRFPNAYRAVKKLFFAEILSVLPILFALLSAPLQASGKISFSAVSDVLPWVFLGIFLLSSLIRILGLGQGKLDQPSFRAGQRAAIIAIVLYLLNLFLVPIIVDYLYELLIKAARSYKDLLENRKIWAILSAILELGVLAAFVFFSVRVTLNIIGSIRMLSLRLQNGKMETRGQWLYRTILLLILVGLCLFLLVELLPESVVYTKVFQLIALVVSIGCAVGLIGAWVWLLVYMKPAEQMLLHAEPEDIWAEHSELLEPTDSSAYSPW